MEIKLISGAEEIGASCIGIRSKQANIIIDYGKPLNDKKAAAPKLDSDIDAVFISHPHQDHYGFIDDLPQSAPIYMSEYCETLIDISRKIIGHKKTEINNPIIHFKDEKPITFKDIKIIPFLADHSAPGAFSFLIKADGKNVFYSGDFRNTGYKQYTLDKLKRYFPKEKDVIDALILEGTTLGREDEAAITEEGLVDEMSEVFKRDAISFVYASSQNIDRFVTVFKAALKQKKTVIIDGYMASILGRLDIKTIPNPLNKQLKIFLYQANLKEEMQKYSANCIEAQEINKDPSKYVFMFHGSMVKSYRFKQIKAKNANFIYSMWSGYKKEQSFEETEKWIAKNNITTKDIHTSGHADRAALKTFVDILKPEAIIPFHTQRPDEYVKIWGDKVKNVKTGDVIVI
jgi:ribonuclease J